MARPNFLFDGSTRAFLEEVQSETSDKWTLLRGHSGVFVEYGIKHRDMKRTDIRLNQSWKALITLPFDVSVAVSAAYHQPTDTYLFVYMLSTTLPDGKVMLNAEVASADGSIRPTDIMFGTDQLGKNYDRIPYSLGELGVMTFIIIYPPRRVVAS